MPKLEVLLMGMIALIGLGWQGYLLFEKDNWSLDSSSDNLPKRVIVPFGFGMVVFLGVTVVATGRLFDASMPNYGFLAALGDVGKAFAFMALISLKAIFAPLWLAFSLCVVVYYGFEHSVLHTVDALSSLLDLVFESPSDTVQYIYAIGSCLYAFAGSLFDSHDWDLHWH